MNLNDSAQAAQAQEFISHWPELPVEDALQILFMIENLPEGIRKYAVDKLDLHLSDDDLQLFLLQMVQALRKESNPYKTESRTEEVERIVKEEKQVEAPAEPAPASEPTPAAPVSETTLPEGEAVSTSTELPAEGEVAPTPKMITIVVEKKVCEMVTQDVLVPEGPLFEFLCRRCSNKRSLASLFMHYLRVESNEIPGERRVVDKSM